MSAQARTYRLQKVAGRDVRDKLRTITGHVLAEVRVTRVLWPEGLRWCAKTLAVDPKAPMRLREVPLADGTHHREIGLLLRGAFPHANWSIAQDYNVTTGVLTEHVTRRPACLRGDEL